MIKSWLISQILLLILMFSIPLNAYSEKIKTGRLVLTSISKIEFVGVCGLDYGEIHKHKSYVEVGCLEAIDGEGEKHGFMIEDIYLITWGWHYNAKNYYPVISDRIIGHVPELTAKDINGDDIDEILVKYHAGAHTDVLRIYRQVECTKLELIPGGEITSDFPLIEIKTKKINDYPVIIAHHKDYLFHGKKKLHTTYRWDGQKYVGTDNER